MTLPADWKSPEKEQIELGREETLWRNQITQGIFNKKVVEVQIITNHRVLRNDCVFGAMLNDIDEMVVMNQHRVSESYTINTDGTEYWFGNPYQ